MLSPVCTGLLVHKVVIYTSCEGCLLHLVQNSTANNQLYFAKQSYCDELSPLQINICDLKGELSRQPSPRTAARGCFPPCRQPKRVLLRCVPSVGTSDPLMTHI